MFDFPDINFPLGDWINIVVDWLTRTLAPFFDVVTEIIRTPLVGIERFLWWLPWWVVIIVFVADRHDHAIHAGGTEIRRRG